LGGILKIGILSGKSYSEVARILEQAGFINIPVERITYWLYRRRIKDFMEMDNVPKALRIYLSKRFQPGYYGPFQSFLSDDLSRKFLFKTRSGFPVESVYIPDSKRNTICISSQAGCRMACSFCNTGMLGFHGDLGTDEILNQVGSIMETDRLTHIVFMGMGEPLDNYENVLKALDILTAQWGFAFSPRNITVSTIGLKPHMKEFLKSTKCNVAVSIHSPFDEERDEIIPSDSKYSIRELVEMIGEHNWEKNRRMTFEYIMIKGLNDTDRHLAGLIRILKGTVIRINLMSYHPSEGSIMQSSTDDIQWLFKKQLIQNGISASIRRSRGIDIGAACGLLGGSNS